MWKVIRISLGVVVLLVTLTVVAVAGAIAIHLPKTSCAVPRDVAEGMAMKQTYTEVRDRIGCDGQLVKREVWGDKLRRDVYQWRGDAWPFGRFEGVFYNDSLEAKETRWIVLNLEPSSSTEAPPADTNAIAEPSRETRASKRQCPHHLPPNARKPRSSLSSARWASARAP